MGGCLKLENIYERLEEKIYDIIFGLLLFFRLLYFLVGRLGKYLLCLIILFCVCLYCMNNGFSRGLYVFCDVKFNLGVFDCVIIINKVYC